MGQISVHEDWLEDLENELATVKAEYKTFMKKVLALLTSNKNIIDKNGELRSITEEEALRLIAEQTLLPENDFSK